MNDVLREQGVALAAYASHSAQSRGRKHPEPSSHPKENRAQFQRDRDRIVHSTAFRRLVYKTQVFLNHEGDLFRTRMTHSLEVAQLGRSMARRLLLNEDLVEAIALAHDLGHTPFGHTGQDALNACMQAHGGFEHNLQSLRVVDVLEHRYPEFDGLNLCFETREGILKHCSRKTAQELEIFEPGGVGCRFLDKTSPSLEAQMANLADEIAYNAHDIDDGVRSGLLSLEQMQEQPLFGQFLKDAQRHYPQLGAQQSRRLLYEAVRRMLSSLVYDVIETTQSGLDVSGVQSTQQVRAQAALVRFSADVHAQSVQLKRFLFTHLYRHQQVVRTSTRAHQVVTELFQCYVTHVNEMPVHYQQRAKQEQNIARIVSDYIAGMTDRFAIKEHVRLTGSQLFQDI